MFGKEIYMNRRAALRAKLSSEKGIVIFIGNVDAPAQYRDNCYKFRQDSTWLYYFGIDEPRFAAVMDLDSGVDTIFADDFTLDDIIWMGPTPTVAEQAALTGIEKTDRYDKLGWVVTDALIKARPIHFAPASRYYNALKLGTLIGLDPKETMSRDRNGCPAASRALVDAIISQRLVKGPEEIEAIDAACRIGQKMHLVARAGIRPGRIEQEIVADMEAVALGEGWGVSFPTILTQHGEVFHCHSHSLPVEPGRLMVVDAGVESCCHYASDFTRTYPTSGKFTPKQRDIYSTVVDCHELAFSMVAPGVQYREVHIAAATLMLQHLKDLGLVNGDPAEMAADGIAGLFMPHGLGHNMGLDVHDMEDYGENLVGYDPDQSRSSQLGLGSLRMARRLKAGNVITDEPGIYFIPDLIEQWKRDGVDGGRVNYDKLREYYDFGGIRVEDDVLVTEDGARRLGGERLAASASDVEAAMENDKDN